MTLDQLETLLRHPEVNRLPLELATASASPTDRWWQLHERLVEYEVQLSLWSAGQHLVLLFDTYGGLVKEVKVAVTLETTRDEIFASHQVLINDVFCDSSYDEFEEEDNFKELVEARDGGVVFRAAVAALNDVIGSHVIANLATAKAALEPPFTTSAQARAMVEQFASPMRARIDVIRLAECVDSPARPSKPRVPGKL